MTIAEPRPTPIAPRADLETPPQIETRAMAIVSQQLAPVKSSRRKSVIQTSSANSQDFPVTRCKSTLPNPRRKSVVPAPRRMTQLPARRLTEYPIHPTSTSQPRLLVRVDCKVCNINLARNYFEKHLITHKHIYNVKIAQEEMRKQKEEENSKAQAGTRMEIDEEEGIKYEEVDPDTE